MVLTVSFVLSPVTMLVCHRRLRFTRQLDTSVGVSGPHDFSVRVSALRPWRHPRPPHPASNVFDDRETPLRGNGTAGDIDLIWVKREVEYFCKRGWTGRNRLIRFNKSPFCHCSFLGQGLELNRRFQSSRPPKLTARGWCDPVAILRRCKSGADIRIPSS